MADIAAEAAEGIILQAEDIHMAEADTAGRNSRVTIYTVGAACGNPEGPGGFRWVKGHDGHPENERCDKLATTAADGENLLDDNV